MENSTEIKTDVGKVRLVPEGSMTIKQAMDFFGVSRVTIHNWRKQKSLPYEMIPCNDQYSVRFNRSALIDWASARGITINGEYVHESK